MQTCDLDSPCLSAQQEPGAARANASASTLREYLHEDIAQTLCAVKVRLEGLAQRESRDANLKTSIAALQEAIRQLSVLAADVPPMPGSGSAAARARSSGGNRLRPARGRKRAYGNAHQAPANLAVDFAALLSA